MGGKEGVGTRRRVRFAIFAALALLPSAAHAQDASILVYLFVPPVLLAPLAIGLVRWMWLVRQPGSRTSFAAVLGLSAVEVLLWTLSAASAAYVYFAEKGFILAALILGITVFVDWRIDRRLHPAGSRIGALRILCPPFTLVVLVGLSILARR